MNVKPQKKMNPHPPHYSQTKVDTNKGYSITNYTHIYIYKE